MGTPPPIMMANVSMADTILLMVLALVVFGPRRLPQIGRQIGKLMYEFRKASNDFKFQMEEELRQSEEADRRKKEEAERQKALAAAPPAPQLEQPAVETTPATPEAPTESPYPGETTYPDLAAENTAPEEATQPEESTEALTAAAVDAARFRIRPVSTGEVVAANPPGPPAQQTELFEHDAAPQPSEPAAEPAANDNASGANEAANEPNRSEPATHNG